MARIALLEDDRLQGTLLSDLLKTMGHDVVLESNVASLLTRLNDEKFDLIATDFFLSRKGQESRVSGATVIISARFSGITGANIDPDIAIVAISGLYEDVGGRGPLSLCETLGADAVVSKPCMPKALEDAIGTALCAGTARRKLRALNAA